MATSRVLTFVLVVLFGVAAWMTYDNVYSDVEPTKALAEATACSKKSCKEQHGLTKVTRSTFDQTFEYTWPSGVVTVVCHREGYAYGPMRCEAR